MARVGDIISRVVFGGFWSLVALGAGALSLHAFSAGRTGAGFGALLVGVLAGLYAAYIFRGGRIRILFW